MRVRIKKSDIHLLQLSELPTDQFFSFKVLFEMASYYSPSIIFIDEVETLASDRSAPGEHEASRRLKAQLLTELDGIESKDGIIFLLANSNMPW